MTVFVLRHADAGDREDWTGDDNLRPLSKKGHRQRDALARSLTREKITRILSSPAVRCVETVEPLGAALDLPIEETDAIAEGAPLAETLALIDKLSDETALLCTHGDVVGNLLWQFQRDGLDVGEGRMQKASIWVFRIENGTAAEGVYMPPPPK